MQNNTNKQKLRGLDPNAKLQSLTVRLQALQNIASELPTRTTHRECGFTHEQVVNTPLLRYSVTITTRTKFHKEIVFATSILEATKHPRILELRKGYGVCTITANVI